MGKTYRVYCHKGYNRDSCVFRQQDPELICVQCSFARFIERQKQKTEEKSEVKQDEQR